MVEITVCEQTAVFQVRIRQDCIMHKVYVPSLTGLISWYRIFSEVTLVAKNKNEEVHIGNRRIIDLC